MALTEAEELELLELEHEEAMHKAAPAPNAAQPPDPESLGKTFARGALDALPVATGVAGGILGSSLGPVGTVGGGALAYAGGKELSELGKHYLLGDEAPSTAPIDQVGRVASGLRDGAMNEMGGQVVAKALPNVLERAATSPLPEQIAKTANVTGHAKGIVNKLMPMIKNQLPESLQSVSDLVSGVIGRKAAYSNLATGIPQGISDAAALTAKGQKGLAWALDKAPALGAQASKALGTGAAALANDSTQRAIESTESGGKNILDPSELDRRLSNHPEAQRFSGAIRNAASRGQESLASTHFILSQTEPDYQKAVQGGQ